MPNSEEPKTFRNTSRIVLTAALRLRRLCERLVRNLIKRSRPSAYEMLPPLYGRNRSYGGSVNSEAQIDNCRIGIADYRGAK
jgi:hypothetical protein